jgi:enamine deaminase RidA (YjgF/YER057c/UK114 family)
MANRLRFISPKTIAKPTGYTHVVEVTTPSRFYYISGQLGRDLSGKLVGAPGDFEAQAVQTFENLKAALNELGAQFSDVIKLNNYLTDIKYLPIFRDVRDRYVNVAAPPASTLVQISNLAMKDALLEVEAIAVLPALEII